MDCVHHWLLQDKQDGRSPGRCKKCGAERVFVERTVFEWSLTNQITGRDFAEAIERRQAMMQEEV